MNTQKQITLMVALVFVLLGGCAAYTVYDQPREESAAGAQQARLAERGARIFAQYCRQCHGNAGEGRIGPAIGSADPYRDPAKLTENELWITDTLNCGRLGKVMPPWSIREGGALNDEQIRDVVTLITTNAGDGWKKAGEFSAEANALAQPPGLQPADEVLAAAAITGAGTTRVCGQLVSQIAPQEDQAAAQGGNLPSGVTAKDQWDETTTDNKFSVTAIAVNAGTPATVKVDNQGKALHNWEALGPDGKVVQDDNGKNVATPSLVDPGKQASVAFTLSKPGVYSFRCQVHPQEMVGKLYVVGPDGTAGGGNAAGAAPGSPAASGTPSPPGISAPTPAAGSTTGQPAPTVPGSPAANAGAGNTTLTEQTTDNKFSQTKFSVPAGKPVQMTVSNKGTAVHNWHVLNVKDANGSDIKTDLLDGGKSAQLSFTITKAGTYNFQCDVHPTEMKGTITVQ